MPPNVVLLFSDQHRFDAASCNGAPVCRTPSLDAIASKGLRFTRAYTPISLCSPARGSLLTGLYPHNHGQLANMANFNRVFDRQIMDKIAFPALLSAAGYRVGYVGKWHLPEEGDRHRWGFDEWYDYRDWREYLSKESIDFDYGRDDVQRLEWGGDAPFCGRSKLPAERTYDAWIADRAVELISRLSKGKTPFMICAGFWGPHFPYAVPEPYDSMYDPASVNRWGNFDETFVNKPLIQQKEMLRWNSSHLTWPQWQRVIAHYWGYCSFVDAQIEKILACIADSGVEERTVVFYTTDHGDMLGSHRIFNKGMNMYEETHHIPFLVSGPGVTRPGATQSDATCDSFISLVDLMPTFLDIAGVEHPEDLDGRSLLPLLKGEAPVDWPDDVLCEFHGYEAALCTIRMIRTDRWKYVYNPCSVDELYDLESDPQELRNLAPLLGFKHILRRMKGRLVNRLRETGDSIVAEGSWQSNSYDLLISKREE
jgi:arylsulfatase A-like enzyme